MTVALISLVCLIAFIGGAIWLYEKFEDGMKGFFDLLENIERIKSKFWSIIHNLIAHPLLITGTKWADRFHDWTATKF